MNKERDELEEYSKYLEHCTREGKWMNKLGAIQVLKDYKAQILKEAKSYTDKTGMTWIDTTKETADMMWECYAQAEPDTLDKSAKEIRLFLLNIAEKSGLGDKDKKEIAYALWLANRYSDSIYNHLNEKSSRDIFFKNESLLEIFGREADILLNYMKQLSKEVKH